MFLAPGSEVLVARDGGDVIDIMQGLTAERAKAIGQSARQRILAEHTYDRRAAVLHPLLQTALLSRREVLAA
jgi:spore maturation protein CgeB